MNNHTLQALQDRTVAWAQTRTDIRAVLLIGSLARKEYPADQWSDLDLLVLVTDNTLYADPDAKWLSALGDVLIVAVEEANAGDPDVQAIFTDGSKGDFSFVTVHNPERPLDELLAELTYQDVLRRGVVVLFDRYDAPRSQRSAPTPTPALPSEAQFNHLVNGFWLYAFRTAKFTRRGDLWRASTNLSSQLHQCLLTLIEWHAQVISGRDTWYNGRFMQDWADPRALSLLPQTFAHYDADDLRRALYSVIVLFRLVAIEIAQRLSYEYRVEQDEETSAMIEAIFEASDNP